MIITMYLTAKRDAKFDAQVTVKKVKHIESVEVAVLDIETDKLLVKVEEGKFNIFQKKFKELAINDGIQTVVIAKRSNFERRTKKKKRNVFGL